MHFSPIHTTRYLFVLFLCVWTSACSKAYATPIISPTFEVTVNETSTPSKTPIPSNTPKPSRTPFPPSATKTDNQKIQATLTQQAENDYLTKVAEFSFECSDEIRPSISPNENWAALSCGYKRDQTLEIVNKTGKRWVLKYKDYLPNVTSDNDIPMGNLFPDHWSNDEEYLYYEVYIAYDGGGTCFYGFGSQGLYRINLLDGTISTILPVTPTVFGYEIAFSPTGRRLAYQGIDEPRILDLQTGEEITIKVGNDITGDFTWSPDGSELAYATCQVHPESNGDYTVKKSAIKIFSIQNQSSRTILEVEKNFLTIDDWNNNNIIEIKNEDFQANTMSYMYFDSQSAMFVTDTPMP